MNKANQWTELIMDPFSLLFEWLPTHYCRAGLPDRDPPGQRFPGTETPPPWTESQTGVKTLLYRDLVAGGNNGHGLKMLRASRSLDLCLSLQTRLTRASLIPQTNLWVQHLLAVWFGRQFGYSFYFRTWMKRTMPSLGSLPIQAENKSFSVAVYIFQLR